jgi:hypothetical protein
LAASRVRAFTDDLCGSQLGKAATAEPVERFSPISA